MQLCFKGGIGGIGCKKSLVSGAHLFKKILYYNFNSNGHCGLSEAVYLGGMHARHNASFTNPVTISLSCSDRWLPAAAAQEVRQLRRRQGVSIYIIFLLKCKTRKISAKFVSNCPA